MVGQEFCLRPCVGAVRLELRYRAKSRSAWSSSQSWRNTRGAARVGGVYSVKIIAKMAECTQRGGVTAAQDLCTYGRWLTECWETRNTQCWPSERALMRRDPRSEEYTSELTS